MKRNGNISAADVTGKPIYSLTGVLLFLTISSTLKYANLIKAPIGNNTTIGIKYQVFIPS